MTALSLRSTPSPTEPVASPEVADDVEEPQTRPPKPNKDQTPKHTRWFYHNRDCPRRSKTGLVSSFCARAATAPWSPPPLPPGFQKIKKGRRDCGVNSSADLPVQNLAALYPREALAGIKMIAAAVRRMRYSLGGVVLMAAAVGIVDERCNLFRRRGPACTPHVRG
jgi:hypothetical protein